MTNDTPPTPTDLALYLTKVYQDPEASPSDKLLAASSLMSFWLGGEVAALTQVFSLAVEQAMAVTQPNDVPGQKLN